MSGTYSAQTYSVYSTCGFSTSLSPLYSSKVNWKLKIDSRTKILKTS